jgi:hypothetical protein
MSTLTGVGACSKPALIMSLGFAARSKAKFRRILFLTSGGAYCSGLDVAHYESAVIAEVAARNTERIPIDVVCIALAGDAVSEGWLKKLAADSGGGYSLLVVK